MAPCLFQQFFPWVHIECNSKKQQLQSDFSRQGYESFSLFPEAGVIAIKDKREWSSSGEELGTSWVVTVCIDSIAAARLSMIQQKIELAQVSLKQKNKFGVKKDIYFYRLMVAFIKEHVSKGYFNSRMPKVQKRRLYRDSHIDLQSLS